MKFRTVLNSQNKITMFIKFLYLLFCTTVWIAQAEPELVWLEDVNNDHDLRHLEIGLPKHLDFNLKRLNGKQLNLHLQENTRLNANAPVFEAVTENGKPKARQLDVPPIIGTKFYQDKSTGAAVKVSCTNQLFGACKRVLEGSVNIDGDSYEIKPSPTILQARGMGSQTEVPHLIVKVAPPPMPKPGDTVRGLFGAHYKRIPGDRNESASHDHKAIPSGQSGEPNSRGFPVPAEPNVRDELLNKLRALLEVEELEDMISEKERPKRAVGDLYAVEVVIVIDPPMWQKYYDITEANNGMNKNTATEYFLRERLAHVMNGVSLRYEEIEDNAMNVYVTISEFLIYKTVESGNPLSPSVQIPVVNGVEYADSDIYIDGLPSWAQTAPITKHSDHIMVMTGYELYYGGNTENSGVAGVAFVSGACGYYRTSVQEDSDYFTLTSVAAHELGHNLGSDHDGSGSSSDCTGNDKYIMAPFVASFSRGQPYSLNPWRFSDCSVRAFKDYFGSGRCFLDHGDYFNKDEWDTHNKLEPGERFSPDEQCKLIKGDNSYACYTSNPEEICRTMLCYDSQDGYCYYYAAARGTPCGDSKWCLEGKCVERTVVATTTTTTRAPTTTTTTTQAPTTTSTTQAPTTSSTTQAPTTSSTTQAPTTTTSTTQAPTTTTTRALTTTTSRTPTTATQAPVTTTTSSGSCVDIGWYDWSCQRVSDYFYDTYFYEPSYWCQDPYWAETCCIFCRDAQSTYQPTTSTSAPTTTEACVDWGYYDWTCGRINRYFKRVYGLGARRWCQDPDWKYTCCEFCTARGF